MNIFILEDNEERMRIFRRNLIGHNVLWANNVEDSKKILKDNFVDIIFLDHDLDNRVYVDSNELNTGYQLAKWIYENNIKYDRLIVHSLNENGRKNIQSIIKNAELIPFFMLFKG